MLLNSSAIWCSCRFIFTCLASVWAFVSGINLCERWELNRTSHLPLGLSLIQDRNRSANMTNYGMCCKKSILTTKLLLKWLVRKTLMGIWKQRQVNKWITSKLKKLLHTKRNQQRGIKWLQKCKVCGLTVKAHALHVWGPRIDPYLTKKINIPFLWEEFCSKDWSAWQNPDLIPGYAPSSKHC